MNNERTAYYNSLVNEIEDWERQGKLAKHKWGDKVKLAPAFFRLLCELEEDPVMADTSAEILRGGIKYFISDVDFLPESLVGISGYLDDIIVAAFVVNEVAREADPEYVRMYWDEKADLFMTINELLTEIDAILGTSLWNKIRSSL
ncbi:MAG: DUF1232 domain-containing protein [Ignavibacteriaceae bacterium]|nr:DUF1232 domain-containing protein [Ignavibacteriaceae bacterium]